MVRRCLLLGVLATVIVGGCGQGSAVPSAAAGTASVAVIPGSAFAPAPSNPPTAVQSAVAPFQAAAWIAFTGHAGEGIGIYLAAPDGSKQHWILVDIPANVVHRPDWSHDGRRIAVEALGAGDLPSGSIWIADDAGRSPRKVAACEALPCLQLAMPAWSPDGLSLAMVRYDVGPDATTWGRTAIEILDLASGRRRTVAETTDAKTSYAYPRWAPDGRSLVLEYDTFPDARQERMTGSAIATLDTTAGGPVKPKLVTALSGFGSHPDRSPDGQRIVFGTYGIEPFETGGPGPSNLYTMAPDGQDLTAVTRFAAGDSRAGHPSWTPDGKRIIFTKVDGTDYDGYGARRIASIDPDGSDLQVIDAFLGTYPRMQPIP